jgi:TorA maturation chaperone TorD
MGEREMNRAEQARARASSYERLALGFGPPSAELTAALSEAEARFSLPALDLPVLIPEYHRLFVGPARLPVPPYESVYREGWQVFGETTLDVKRRYAEAGYTLDPSFIELPDHVAVELAFMALLAEEEAKAWEAQDTAAASAWLARERTFLDDHLSRWLPAFCDRLLASTETSFYRRLAVELREFVTLDAEGVKALTGLLEEALA